MKMKQANKNRTIIVLGSIVGLLIIFALVLTTIGAKNGKIKQEVVNTSKTVQNIKTSGVPKNKVKDSKAEKSTPNYAIDVETVFSQNPEGIKFAVHTMNMPQTILLKQVNNETTVTYDTTGGIGSTSDSQRYSTYAAHLDAIPMKKIKIFGGIGTDGSVRTVKVQTKLTIDDNLGTTSDNKYTGDNYYLFYNAQGSISLITPNYAGNVAKTADQKIMAEYVQDSNE